MNRLSREAMKQYSILRVCEQTYILSKILACIEFQEFSEKLSSKISHIPAKWIPYLFLRDYLAKNFEANTVNGKRKVSKIVKHTDPLKIISQWMPNGRFAPKDPFFYIPLGYDQECTSVMKPHISKYKHKQLQTQWSAIRKHLLSQSIGSKDRFSSAQLDYETKFCEEQDVYFMLDKDASRIKIGVSNNIMNRVSSVRRQYKTGKLVVECVIRQGGYGVENILHRSFSHLRCDKVYRGNEWFIYDDELKSFIEQLNSYAVKSDFILDKLGVGLEDVKSQAA
ncbi:MAG: GIY-YIG nuclease family protein [Parashewanella sp.]